MEYDSRQNPAKNEIKIIQINADNFGNGGISSIIFRFMECLYPQGITVDYLTNRRSIDTKYAERIEKIDGKLVHVSWTKIPVFKEIGKYFATKKALNSCYSLIHINGDDILFMFPYILAAICAGYKGRIILHSHTSRGKSKYSVVNYVRMRISHILGLFVIPQTAALVSCSSEAGLYAYGKKNLRKVRIIKNGIDYSKYSYDEVAASKIRAKYSAKDKIIIGHVGHFSLAKNHTFLLDVFLELTKHFSNIELWLVGYGGEMYTQVTDKIKKMNLGNKVRLLGHIDNVTDYYSAMDVFLFPSLYEGFPLALTEAQANGLPCVFSDCITKECIFSKKSVPISLSKPADQWANIICQILSQDVERKLVYYDSSLSLAKCANELLMIYKSHICNID